MAPPTAVGIGSAKRSEPRVSKDAHYAPMNTGGSYTTPPGSVAHRRYSVSVAMAAASGTGAGAGNQGTGGTGSSSRSGDGRDSLPRSQFAAAEEMHPITLRFKNHELEVAFDLFHRLQFETTWRRVWPVGLLIAAMLQARTVMYDLEVTGLVQPVLDSIAVVVVGVLLPFAVAAALAWSTRLLNRVEPVWHFLMAFLAALSMCLSTIVIAYLSDDDPGLSAATYILTAIVWTCANRARFFYTIAGALPAAVAYGIYFGLLDTPTYPRAIGIVYVCVAYIVLCVLVRDMELTMRHQFTHSSFLLHNNAKLKDQLNHLKFKYTKTGADFDSPLEKVNAMMNSLLADSSLGVDQVRIVANALQLINATNVLQPDLDGQIKAGQVSIDRDTEAWLFTELAQRERTYTAKTKDVVAPAKTDGSAAAPASTTATATGGDAATKPYYMSGLNFDFNPFDAILEGLGLDASDAKAAHQLLRQAETEFNFNVFELDRVTNCHALSVLAMHLFLSHGLLTTFELPLNRLRNFFRKIEAGYRQNPYHNAVHAADVLHATNWFLHQSDLKATVGDMDRLIAFVAAIVHDFDHPGLSNVFQVNASTTRAVVYNDRSVLENHHLAAAFLAMESEENNFLSHFPKPKFREFRHGVIELVLATDLAQHFKILSQFKAKCQADGHLDLTKTEDRLLVLQMAIKAADVSNGAKSAVLYRKWTGLVMEEFYRQGDEERRLGLPISPFMDREAPKLAQCQKGFLEFICLPLYEAFDGFVNIPEVFAQLQSNAAYWASQVDAPGPTGGTGALPMPSHRPPPAPPTHLPGPSDAPGDSTGSPDAGANPAGSGSHSRSASEH